MIKPLRIFRVEMGKPPIAGTIQTFRVYPDAADLDGAVTQAARCVEHMQSLPPEQHALHCPWPLGQHWTDFESPVQALTSPWGAGILPWWDKFFGYLKLRGTTLSIIICDDESAPQGTNPWHAERTLAVVSDPAVRRAMPAKLRSIDPKSIMQLSRDSQIPYSAWNDWLAGKKYAAIQRIAGAYKDLFGSAAEVVNYGDYRYPLLDPNGWANGLSKCSSTSPVSYTGWKSADGDVCGSVWFRGVVFAENEIRSQNRSASIPCRPWVSYPAFVEGGDEHDALRAQRLWAWKMNFRSVVRQCDTIIYWEGPPVDPESDAIAAREIARANDEVTRRSVALPLIAPGSGTIITGDHMFSLFGLRGFDQV